MQETGNLYLGKRKIHFCMSIFSRTKPGTASLLGPQLTVSHLALTVLQPPQQAEASMCRATLKTTALK